MGKPPPLSPIEPPAWIDGTAGEPALAGGPDTSAAEPAPAESVDHDANVAELQAMADSVNPQNDTVNCVKIFDAVVERAHGTDPDAVADTGQGGTASDVEQKHNMSLDWTGGFDDAYAAVEQGGDGTVAAVVIHYDGGGGHIVGMVNEGGTVGIVEGQDWGAAGGREVITEGDRFDQRYNSDGKSDIGWAIVPPKP